MIWSELWTCGALAIVQRSSCPVLLVGLDPPFVSQECYTIMVLRQNSR
jgi:hypothetical protein